MQKAHDTTEFLKVFKRQLTEAKQGGKIKITDPNRSKSL